MEVQVAQLQARVTQLTTHMKEHRKDHSARRGLLIVLGQRNKYLKVRPPTLLSLSLSLLLLLWAMD